jgi:hypothetical protein
MRRSGLIADRISSEAIISAMWLAVLAAHFLIMMASIGKVSCAGPKPALLGRWIWPKGHSLNDRNTAFFCSHAGTRSGRMR